MSELTDDQWLAKQVIMHDRQILREKIMKLAVRGGQIEWTKVPGEPPKGEAINLISRDEVLKLLE